VQWDKGAERLQTGVIMHVLAGTGKKKLLFTREWYAGDHMSVSLGLVARKCQPIAIIGELDELPVLPESSVCQIRFAAGLQLK